MRRAAALGLVTAGVLLITGGFIMSRRAAQKADVQSAFRAQLLDALGKFRPIEGRLVGVPYSPATRPATKWRRGAVESIAREIRRRTGKRRSEATLADEALLSLLAGKLDDATNRLREASHLDPENAAALSDLSAVYLERAHSQPADLLPALVAADQACGLARNLPEARFNRALALERLYLRETAEEAWRSYLAVDSSSAWATEARAHQSQMRDHDLGKEWAWAGDELRDAGRRDDHRAVQRLVYRFPQTARELAEDRLLAEWATELLSGRSAVAARTLALCREIGAALVSGHGEAMLAEAVAAIDKAPGDRELRRYVKGHRLYGEGLALYHRSDFSRARAALVSARTQLAAANSPFAAWATYQVARCDYQHFAYARTLTSVGSLLRSERNMHHPALRARSLWLVGLTHIVQGEPAAALTAYLPALDLFTLLGEAANSSRLHSLSGDALGYQAQTAEAWTHFHQALEIAQRIGDPTAITLACSEAALAATRIGQPQAALDFRDEEVDSARRSQDTLRVSEALKSRATMRAATSDRPALALADVFEAWQLSERIPDLETRRSLQGDLLFARGQIERVQTPRRAIASLAEAIMIYRTTGYHYHYLLAGALYQRALANIAVANLEAAESDLASAVEEGERQRERIPEREKRVAFFAQLHALFDELIRLEINRGNVAAAFSYVERSRSRVLLDWILGLPQPPSGRQLLNHVEHPLTAPEVRRALPERTTVIEIAALHDSLLVWVVRRDSLHFHQMAVAREALEKATARLDLARRQARDREFKSVLAVLYDLIVRPLNLESDGGVVFVPDGPLQGVPFAALYDATRGRYLIQDHEVTVAPSSTILVHSLRTAGCLASMGQLAVLAFGDPDFDRVLFPGLPQLPGAESELKQIATSFPTSYLLRNQQATRKAFLRLAGRYPIVHIGAHAIINTESPLLSEILFAPVASDPQRGVLYAHELLGHRLKHTRLVVLSGCSTAAGRWWPNEGVTSLARSFMASGVPAVIGSLWEADDEGAAHLFSAFYRHLGESADSASAFRAAQLELLATPGMPAAAPWAAFEMIGGIVRHHDTVRGRL